MLEALIAAVLKDGNALKAHARKFIELTRFQIDTTEVIPETNISEARTLLEASLPDILGPIEKAFQAWETVSFYQGALSPFQHLRVPITDTDMTYTWLNREKDESLTEFVLRAYQEKIKAEGHA